MPPNFDPTLLAILRWWFFLFLGGLAFLPLTKKIFKNTPDGAYPFAKIIALVFTSYPLWLLGSLKLLPFASSPIWFLLIPTFLTVLISTLHFPLSHPSPTPQKVSLIIFEEFLFTLAFIFWLFVRAHEPSLQNLEKPMDFGIINSLLRSDFFPSKDMWLAGYNLNYYYYGHFVTALLIKLTAVPPEIGYNLMLATLFAVTFTAAFSFGLNLYLRQGRQETPQKPTTRPQDYRTTGLQIIVSLLTALTLSLFGNLHPIYAFLRGGGTYWYPDATRFIERTIHEFPIYSFVVADLHGHLLDIPFVLLTIFLLYHLWQEYTIPKPQDHKTTRPQDHKLFLLGLLLAILYMTNSVDALIYGVIFCVLLGGAALLHATSSHSITLEYCTKKFVAPIIIVAVTSLVAAAPFLLTFKPFIEGLAIAYEHSPLWQLLILWGGFLPFSLGFLFYFLSASWRTTKLQNYKTTTPQDLFLVLLIIVTILFIIFPELFYFKDIYTTQPRANTLFKFSYQAFIILALLTPYLTFRIVTFWEKSRWGKIIWLTVFILILTTTSSYPFFAVHSYYGDLNQSRTLDINGLTYLKRLYPTDYQALLWLKENIKGQPVILEAVGESYTDAARISANTGLPTVFGWPVHEWLWRQSNRFAALREPEIAAIYETEDLNKTSDLLEKYRVQYVIIGQLERATYPKLAEEKFKKLGKLVFSAGETHLYSLNRITENPKK